MQVGRIEWQLGCMLGLPAMIALVFLQHAPASSVA
jgi:hypothetical protein